LPLWLGLANLAELRRALRAENLYDTSRIGQQSGDSVESKSNGSATAAAGSQVLSVRTTDGSYNDLENGHMGAAGTRFGRNIPIDRIATSDPVGLITPNPRLISEQLLARKVFLPATSLNILAAAWLQFMTRDWFSHGVNETTEPYEIPLQASDPWHQ